MLVYGDLERSEKSSDVVMELQERLIGCAGMVPGLTRHQALIAAFIRAGELVQGVADREFHRGDADLVSPDQDAGNAMLLHLAQAVAASWDSHYEHLPNLEKSLALLSVLSGCGPIRTRQAEGYAFYALYPEAYIAAARQSGLRAETTVIGIRSIGTGLAAAVATALGTEPAITVRPTGHPFQRQLSVSGKLEQRLLAAQGDYAVVDEGPGISGSSFNSVADWLVARGVEESRIHFFPSHGGELGDVAAAEHRERWKRSARHFASFESVILYPDDQRKRLESCVGSLVGPLEQPLKDVSGGAWRSLAGDEPDSWPPADVALEKRKYIAQTGSARWLVKFAGVGARGEDQLQLLQDVGRAGFGPEPAGLCHGFVVMPWIDSAPSADPAPSLDRVLDYLSWRAQLPGTGAGASPDGLFEMASYNLGQRFGAAAELAVRRALGDAGRFSPSPCWTDNRMHSWEWVHSRAGWLKLDAAEHHAAHDLIGCQDIFWDVAGAAVELKLSETERDHLAEALCGRLGRQLDEDFLAANELCYLGFQIGLWTMALDRAVGAERERIDAQLRRYEARPLLRRLLPEVYCNNLLH